MVLEQLLVSIRALVVMSVLTGVLYPLAMTGLSQALFPRQANGSLIVKNGKIIGSEWIGQPFSDPKYFWGRLSATTPACNAAASSGSNFGPLNPALVKTAQDRIDALKKADPGNDAPIPVDLVTASASGLDPHITPAAARYQMKRVAVVRGLDPAVVETLVRKNTAGRFLGVLGEPRVNVLALNLDLDAAQRSAHESTPEPR